MKKGRFLLFILLFLVLGGVFIFYERSNQEKQRQSERETRVAPVQHAIAPNFTLPDLSGRQIELAAVY